MDVAAAIAPIFVKRRSLRIQRLADQWRVGSMYRFGQANYCVRRGLAVICCQCDIARAIVKNCYSCDISFAAFFLLAMHCLRRLPKRGLSQTGFANIH
jgi:hypothetical protein